MNDYYITPNKESVAVTTVIALATSLYTNLDPKINKGDKGIAFDGAIDVYNSSNIVKANFKGSVPVQVKGDTIKTEQLSKCSYPIDMVDLDIYYAQG